MSEVCVLDASAVLSILVAGQSTPSAKAFFLDSDHEWIAPRLLHLEVRNAIRRLERRGNVLDGAIDEQLALFESEVRFEEVYDAALLSSIPACARKASLSVYNATYLETARRCDAGLASRDADLLNAALNEQIKTFDLR